MPSFFFVKIIYQQNTDIAICNRCCPEVVPITVATCLLRLRSYDAAWSHLRSEAERTRRLTATLRPLGSRRHLYVTCRRGVPWPTTCRQSSLCESRSLPWSSRRPISASQPCAHWHRTLPLTLYIGWQWRNFLVFVAILWVKLIRVFTAISLKYALLHCW